MGNYNTVPIHYVDPLCNYRELAIKYLKLKKLVVTEESNLIDKILYEQNKQLNEIKIEKLIIKFKSINIEKIKAVLSKNINYKIFSFCNNDYIIFFLNEQYDPEFKRFTVSNSCLFSKKINIK